MYGFRKWRWSALAVVFGLAASAARAEMITPDSIPNPPTAVAPNNGTPDNTSNLVSTQYAGLGLMLHGAVITSLDGVSMWVPSTQSSNPSPGGSVGAINYLSSLGGSLVSPGSSNPTTVSSLSLTTFGLIGTPTLKVNGLNGQSLNIVPVLQSGVQIFGLQEWTVTGPGISSFSISAPNNQNGPWGVAGVSFTPTTATAPEPSSFVLAALGALGLAARRRWRRVPVAT